MNVAACGWHVANVTMNLGFVLGAFVLDVLVRGLPTLHESPYV